MGNCSNLINNPSYINSFSPLKKWGIVQSKSGMDNNQPSFSPLKKWGIVQAERRRFGRLPVSVPLKNGELFNTPYPYTHGRGFQSP